MRDGHAPSMFGVQLETDEGQQQTTDAARHAPAGRIHPGMAREQQAQPERYRCGVQRTGQTGGKADVRAERKQQDVDHHGAEQHIAHQLAPEGEAPRQRQQQAGRRRVHCGVLHVQVHEAACQQTPPLPLHDQRAAVLQRAHPGVGSDGEQEQAQCKCHRRERRATADGTHGADGPGFRCGWRQPWTGPRRRSCASSCAAAAWDGAPNTASVNARTAARSPVTDSGAICAACKAPPMRAWCCSLRKRR